jgi:demethylspheroidene O-methyltransferase
MTSTKNPRTLSLMKTRSQRPGSSTEKLVSKDVQSAIRKLAEIMRAPVFAALLDVTLSSGLAKALGKRAMTLKEITALMKWDETIAGEFVNAITRNDWFQRDPSGRYRCSPMLSALVDAEGLTSEIVKNWRLVESDCALLQEILKTGRLDNCSLYRKWQYKGGAERGLGIDTVATYSRDMDVTSDLHSEIILEAIDLSRKRKCLDIGGGYGKLACRACERNPGLNAQVFDLPEIEEEARLKIQGRKMKSRVAFVSGNFFNDALPMGADIVFLSRILYDWPDPKAQQILRNAYDCMVSGGHVVVYEAFYVGDKKVDQARIASAIQHLFFGGRIRSVDEMVSMLKETGFYKVEAIKTKLAAYRVIRGLKK